MISESNTAHWLATAFFLFILVAIPLCTQGQFIDLRLRIDSELTATTEQQLSFGKLPSNSGRKSIELGSLNMGVFSITGLEKQRLLIDLQKPDQLIHDNPAIEETVPLQLFARYAYTAQGYDGSVPLTESTNSIKIKSNPDPGPWNTIYLFIYGSVDIGNVPDGVYSNQIVLNVEYI